MFITQEERYKTAANLLLHVGEQLSLLRLDNLLRGISLPKYITTYSLLVNDSILATEFNIKESLPGDVFGEEEFIYSDKWKSFIEDTIKHDELAAPDTFAMVFAYSFQREGSGELIKTEDVVLSPGGLYLILREFTKYDDRVKEEMKDIMDKLNGVEEFSRNWGSIVNAEVLENEDSFMHRVASSAMQVLLDVGERATEEPDDE